MVIPLPPISRADQDDCNHVGTVTLWFGMVKIRGRETTCLVALPLGQDDPSRIPGIAVNTL
jgi:hypothetical protein